MRDITIDSMILQLPAMPEFDAKRLALEITHRLADAKLSGAAGEIPKLRVEAPASAVKDPSELAERIVAQMLREIRQAP
jgi:hypothetical protein